MIAIKQPVAVGYFQLWPLPSVGSPKDQVAKQEAAILDYFQRAIEPRGVVWTQVVREMAAETKRGLFSMPEGRRAIVDLRAGDHLVVPTVESAFHSADDFFRTVDRLARDDVWLHVVDIAFDSSNAAQIGRLRAEAAAVEQWNGLDSRQVSRRRQVANWKGRLAGKHVAGSPPLGFKVVGAPGKRVLVPDEEAREIMGYIVKLHAEKNWGFYRISTHLRDENIRWIRRDGKGRRSLEYWTADRCETAYYRMLQIIDAEKKGEQFWPRPIPGSRRRRKLV